MRFVPLNRGGLQDDHGTDGYVMKRPGEVAIRAGYTDIVISYDGERLKVGSYFAGDLENVWDSFTHTDEEIRKWGLQPDWLNSLESEEEGARRARIRRPSAF